MPTDYRLAEYIRMKYEASNMMSLYLSEMRLDVYKVMGLLGIIGFSAALVAVFIYRISRCIIQMKNIEEVNLTTNFYISTILKELIFISILAMPVSLIDTMLQYFHADFNMDAMLFCLKYKGLDTDNIPITSTVSSAKMDTMTLMSSYKDGLAYTVITVILIAGILVLAILEEHRANPS